jgi:hypothetical protein
MAKRGFALRNGISGQNLPQVHISSLQMYSRDTSFPCLNRVAGLCASQGLDRSLPKDCYLGF